MAADLRTLGVEPGATVLVHSSLSALGWVCGGPVAVIQSLLDVLTPAGTLVMPAHTSGLTEPAAWQNPPIPSAWWQTVRDAMPAFDPRLMPSTGMGRIAELFRTWPGSLRSFHPAVSFSALGPQAAIITSGHTLDFGLGEGSPLARIYDLDGFVLLLGVGHANNTSFHLAEYRAGGAKQITQGAPIEYEGVRVWKTYRDVDWNDEPFSEIGAAFDETGQTKIGKVGSAETHLFPQRAAVDFATRWLRERGAAPTA